MRIPQKILRATTAALAVLVSVSPLAAQATRTLANTGFQSPAELIGGTLDAFASASPEEFDGVYPFPDARQLVRWAAQAGWTRHSAGGRVIQADAHRAVIQLSGHPVTGSSGYETSLGRMFTGLYEAERDSAGWRLTRRLPIAMGNSIRAHAATIALDPGQGLTVSDTIDLTIGSSGGVWLTLNRVAELRAVELNGRATRHELSGGLLWIAAASPGNARVHLAYTLDVRRDSARNANFGRFEPDFGHVRDQHYWLPFLGFDAPESVAAFRLTITAPAAFAVVTGLPQRDTIVAGQRIVTAASGQPTPAVTLMYDRGWKPMRRTLGAASAELFLADSVEPSRNGIDSALTAVYTALAKRFGDPRSGYVALVQGRALNGWGWLFRSNDMVVAGRDGGPLERTGGIPRALFGHEVAHGWTSSSGAGRNLLSEGWAMFAEGLLISDGQGAAAERRFWEWMRSTYHTEGHEGKNTIIGDDFNSGVSYAKGGWILRMLQDAMSREPFDRGMRAFMAAPPSQQTSLTAFTAAMSAEVTWDVAAFLRPWLEESRIPALSARVEGGQVIIRQEGPLYRLPVEVEVRDGDGAAIRRRTWIARREDTLVIDGIRAPVHARVDPDHRILMHRTEGDTVRLTLDAPDAKEVALRGSFTSSAIPSVRRADGLWEVALPVTEGLYGYVWIVDGKRRDPADGGMLEVAPAMRLDRSTAYPR